MFDMPGSAGSYVDETTETGGGNANPIYGKMYDSSVMGGPAWSPVAYQPSPQLHALKSTGMSSSSLLSFPYLTYVPDLPRQAQQLYNGWNAITDLAGTFGGSYPDNGGSYPLIPPAVINPDWLKTEPSLGTGSASSVSKIEQQMAKD